MTFIINLTVNNINEARHLFMVEITEFEKRKRRENILVIVNITWPS